MAILKLTNGREIECDQVTRASLYDVLHIHTHAISPIEAYQILTPENTETLVVSEEGQEDRTYGHYTVLYSVQKSPFYKNDILIWLTRPEDI